MGIQNLPLDEQDRIVWVIEWIKRMGRRYDGIVYEKNGKTWDWGQALCRECYGPDWSNIIGESPTQDDIERARRWEAGDIPKWVDKRLTRNSQEV